MQFWIVLSDLPAPMYGFRQCASKEWRCGWLSVWWRNAGAGRLANGFAINCCCCCCCCWCCCCNCCFSLQNKRMFCCCMNHLKFIWTLTKHNHVQILVNIETKFNKLCTNHNQSAERIDPNNWNPNRFNGSVINDSCKSSPHNLYSCCCLDSNVVLQPKIQFTIVWLKLLQFPIEMHAINAHHTSLTALYFVVHHLVCRTQLSPHHRHLLRWHCY